ncbi:hypothetical protein LINPERPRIM_LOCUS42937 [Linum perenne]
MKIQLDVLLVVLTCASFCATLSYSSDPVPTLRRPSPFRPLCVSQIALANYACTSVMPGLPFSNSPGVPSAVVGTVLEPSEMLYGDVKQEEDNSDENDDSGGGETGGEGGGETGGEGGGGRGGGSSGGGSGGSGSTERHQHRHRSPPRREHDGDGHNATPKHRHRGGGGHAHRHRAHRTETPSGRDGDDDDNDTDNNDDGDDDGDDEDDDRELPPMSPAENNCCKWVRDVDDECVCELLMRLPTFLARPFHEYTITVSEWCKVTYSCGGRPRP